MALVDCCEVLVGSVEATEELVVSVFSEALPPELPPLTLILDVTFLTPSVSSASAMAWLTCFAFCAEPERVISLLCASTSMEASAVSE